MSVWDNPQYQASQYEANSPFINKRLAPGKKEIFIFKAIQPKTRAEGTKIGKEGDPYFELYFDALDGKEVSIQQNSPKGSFFRAIREASPEPGEKVEISRVGEGVETRYSIVKLREDGTQLVDEKSDSIPF